MKAFKLSLLASALLVAAGAAAQAADVDAYTPPDSSMTGFYLRADAGWSFLEWSGGADDSNFMLGGGIGYRYNENLRTDLTYDWAGDYNVAPGADMNVQTVLANLYFDVANDSMFTPYVGAGLGYGWASDTPTGNESGLALGLTAGVGVDLTSNLTLDVGYRFRDVMISGPDSNEHQIMTGLRFNF